jgi:uncharacterized protein (TIGR02677 family)
MNKAKNNIHVLIFSNEQEERTRYKKIVTSINALKNTMPHTSTLSYSECKQGWEQSFGECLEAADITLLLVSFDFVGSPHYQNEIEITLRKHSQGKTRVIPILLSPAAWEESRLSELKPLPSDRVPISKWPTADEAISDISYNLRRIIQQILKDRGYVEEPEEDVPPSDNIPISSTAFNWTEKIDPFSYLTFSNKDQEEGISRLSRLRMIMRICYEHKKFSIGDSLSEQEIYEIVREKFRQRSDNEYDFQDCQTDLKYLASHFNLVRLDDMKSMASSIAAFDALLHQKFYQITSDGFEIEHLIESRMQSHSGRLSKSDLSDVKQKLLEINEYTTRNELSQDDIDAIGDKWNSIFKTWERILMESGDYLSGLERNAQYGQYDLQKFMEYKNTVANYVQSFANALQDISHEINELFAGWQEKQELLIEVITKNKYRNHPDLEKRPSLEETIEQIRAQMMRLQAWFKKDADVFCERATSEIHRVVNRATSLALYQRSRVNNVSVLRDLASQLMQETSFEHAQQLFNAAFAHILPMHISENLAGYAQIYEQPETTLSVWDEPAPARVFLVPAKQKNGSTGIRKPDDPLYENRQETFALQEQEMQKAADHQERLSRLFAQYILHLDTFVSIDPLDRTILEEIIDRCLNNPASQYQDPDGNIVVLLNPCEQRYMHLCSPDGVLFLPCYQLKRQNLQKNDD